MCASGNYDRLAEQLSECEAKWNMTADALVMATGQIGELVELLDHALSYTCCAAYSPSLTQEIKAALAKLGADKKGETA